MIGLPDLADLCHPLTLAKGYLVRTITYHGPSDVLKVGDRRIRKDEPTEVPNQIADEAKRRCGDRLTVEVEPDEGMTEGENNGP